MRYADPFQTPRPTSVLVTSRIHAVRLAAIVILDETDTTELAWKDDARCVVGVAP